MKEFVTIRARVGAFGDTPKAVQIQLTLERGQLGVTKVLGENFRDESIRVPDGKGVTRRQPRDNGSILLFEHVHQFARKGIGPGGRTRRGSGGRQGRGRR